MLRIVCPNTTTSVIQYQLTKKCSWLWLWELEVAWPDPRIFHNANGCLTILHKVKSSRQKKETQSKACTITRTNQDNDGNYDLILTNQSTRSIAKVAWLFQSPLVITATAIFRLPVTFTISCGGLLHRHRLCLHDCRCQSTPSPKSQWVDLAPLPLGREAGWEIGGAKGLIFWTDCFGLILLLLAEMRFFQIRTQFKLA